MFFPLILCLLGCLSACSSRSTLWDGSSCSGRCGDKFDASLACQCNESCASHKDCCSDYESVCKGSCVGRCGGVFDPSQPCQCNSFCEKNNDCCSDYADCSSDGGEVTEDDLISLSETLFSLETNNVGDRITLDLGCITSSGNTQDCSPNRLFASVDESVFTLPIYQKLIALFDNYERKVTQGEDHSEVEHQEEIDFIQAVMETDIMRANYEFLAEKEKFIGTYAEFGDKLYNLWFKMYERSNGVLGSSGFEHVFIGEEKNGEVSGFHNWFRFYTQERDGHMNYLGRWRHADLGANGQKGQGLEFTFLWNGVDKPYGSFMIGTSPELEMALYTTCLLTFPDKQCHVRLAGTDVYIQTWTMYYNGELMVGSSYPDFAE